MQVLENKRILLISPQSWGKMFISKHHYALELAKMGNTVYFLNPPEIKKPKRSKRILIEPSTAHENLFLIHHRLSFPYDIKFHFISLFHKLMKSHIKKLLRLIGKPVDIVWSFDLGHLYPFEFFPESSLKIFHPVDEPLNKEAISSAKGASMILSVTPEILQKYGEVEVPKHIISHGVSGEFLDYTSDHPKTSTGIKVGISGNLLRADIDRDILLTIISQNPKVIFEFWGSYKTSHSNIGGSDNHLTRTFIEQLQSHNNVVLHGVISYTELAKSIRHMDAFLVCYDVEKDQSKGTNYHKIMEYISTGKVVIANNISAYLDRPDFVQMVQERNHNNQLPALFEEVIHRLEEYNAMSLQEKRKTFAKDNSYQRQVERIADILNSAPPLFREKLEKLVTE